MIQGLYDCFSHWHERGTVWCISDTHFGDRDLRADQSNRPSDEEIVARINSKVGRTDTLILLGDVGDTTWARKLRGYKVLIMGNHDTGAGNYRKAVVSKSFDINDFPIKELALSAMSTLYPDYKYTIEKGYDVLHAPFEYWWVRADNQLFNEVYTGPLTIGEKVILSHEPLNIDWAINFHGHDHQGSFHKDNRYNFCCEAVDFTPVNLNQLFKQGLGDVKSLHRQTIDTATKRANKRKIKEKKK